MGRKGIYRQFGCLVNIYTKQNRIRGAVLAELGRIQRNAANCYQVTVRITSGNTYRYCNSIGQ